ncbi:MAG: GAF domain-containing protein [bacterium]
MVSHATVTVMAGTGSGEGTRRTPEGRVGDGPLRELRLLERVGKLIRDSHDLRETLESVVGVVAERMRTEVCSFYLLDDEQTSLDLWATTGLDRDAIGKVQMGVSEGLTGLVIESMDRVIVNDAPVHPRFKFFPELGEERYHSFLGVPVRERDTALGVLVVQTLRRRSFTKCLQSVRKFCVLK